jgi:hypothetical protein
VPPGGIIRLTPLRNPCRGSFLRHRRCLVWTQICDSVDLPRRECAFVLGSPLSSTRVPRGLAVCPQTRGVREARSVHYRAQAVASNYVASGHLRRNAAFPPFRKLLLSRPKSEPQKFSRRKISTANSAIGFIASDLIGEHRDAQCQKPTSPVCHHAYAPTIFQITVSSPAASRAFARRRRMRRMQRALAAVADG